MNYSFKTKSFHEQILGLNVQKEHLHSSNLRAQLTVSLEYVVLAWVNGMLQSGA